MALCLNHPKQQRMFAAATYRRRRRLHSRRSASGKTARRCEGPAGLTGPAQPTTIFRMPRGTAANTQAFDRGAFVSSCWPFALLPLVGPRSYSLVLCPGSTNPAHRQQISSSPAGSRKRNPICAFQPSSAATAHNEFLSALSCPVTKRSTVRSNGRQLTTHHPHRTSPSTHHRCRATVSSTNKPASSTRLQEESQ